MNIKTALISGIVLVIALIAGVLSYIGHGLPTQNDPLSIRELSAQNQRSYRSGSFGYGK